MNIIRKVFFTFCVVLAICTTGTSLLCYKAWAAEETVIHVPVFSSWPTATDNKNNTPVFKGLRISAGKQTKGSKSGPAVQLNTAWSIHLNTDLGKTVDRSNLYGTLAERDRLALHPNIHRRVMRFGLGLDYRF